MPLIDSSAYHQEKEDRHPPSCQVAGSCFLPWLIRRFSFGKNDLLSTRARRLISPIRNMATISVQLITWCMNWTIHVCCLASFQSKYFWIIGVYRPSSATAMIPKSPHWLPINYAPLFLSIAHYWVLIEDSLQVPITNLFWIAVYCHCHVHL